MTTTMCYFKKQFNSGIYNPPTMVTFLPDGGFIPQEMHCVKIPVTISPTLMKMVIGKDGYYFNGITKASKTEYIWYEKDKNVVEIWGAPSNLEDAKKRLMDRMNLISAKISSTDVIYDTQDVKCIKIPITIDSSLMCQVIGKDGCHFNSIKSTTNIISIWCKREDNVIEIWGPSSNLEDAKQKLLNKMKEISGKDHTSNHDNCETDSTCISVDVTVDAALMSKVIGKDGYYFNCIKKASNITSIWCKREDNVIEVWGPSSNLEDAKQRLIQRMNYIKSMY